jgi:AAA15 family ATPase/GTPase
MRYKSFTIRNFKGIRETSIKLDPHGAARVYSLVGLNESGKTTILEAIHSFSPDADTQIVVGSVSTVEEQRRQRVPKDKISDFTGNVFVSAGIVMDKGDHHRIVEICKNKGIFLDPKCLPNEFNFQRTQKYKDGDFVASYRLIDINFSVKTGKLRAYRKPIWNDEESKIYQVFESMIPSIAYYPTFIFDFPARINLSERNVSKVNSFYRRLFQDILDYDGKGHRIDAHILDRVGKDEYKIEFVNFLPMFTKSNDGEKIQQVVDRAARAVTNVVFEKWNRIFNEEIDDKEIIIKFSVDEAPDIVVENKKEKSKNHDVWIEFFVKDGVKRFPIKDRSLGFRWFFSFLLFTQFRAARSENRAVLFLLDEPASNLHAAAQQKLIESFPEIARDPHSLIYSTHSHYMINPNWLEQCYVVQNDPADGRNSIADQASLDDDAYDVSALPYRRFVSENPTKTSYFQPIIDRLNVVPSRFDIDRKAIIVEGKSDYYILEYFRSVHWKSREFGLIPGVGSGALEALIAIHRGWGLPVRVLLDSDDAGKKEGERYRDLFLLSDREVFGVGDIIDGLKEIESLIGDEDLLRIGGSGRKASKKQVLECFQAALASTTKLKLAKETERRAKAFIKRLSDVI